MLQNIRERIQGWFAGIIIALIALSFIFFGIESYLKSDNPNLATVAEVNGDKITAQQLQERYHRLLDQIPNANALSEQSREQIQQQALTQLINEVALIQIAREMGLEVSSEELSKAIISVPAFQIDGRFSLAHLQQVLMANHLTLAAFEEQMSRMLLLNQLRAQIQNTTFTLPREVLQSYALLEQQRDIGYFEISVKQVAANFHASELQIQDYYRGHQNVFMVPEQLSIQYVQLSPAQVAKQVKLSDAEIHDYYQQHLNSFPKNKKFAELKANIEQNLRQEKTEQLLAEQSEELANLSFTHPDSLEAIAKDLQLPIQQTPNFTRQGLKTGILSEPKVVAAAFSEEVLEDGDNSNPVELKEGSLLVLRINKHQAAAAKPLAEVRSEIEEKLMARQAQQSSRQLAERVMRALNKGSTVSELAQQYQLHWLTRNGIKLDSALLPRVLVAAAFNQPFDGQASKAVLVALPQGDYAVLQVLAQHSGSAAQLTKAQQKAWLVQMAAHQAQVEYELYEQAILQRAKIKSKNLAKLDQS